MTLFALLGAARKRWLIVLVGLALTLPVGLAVARTKGVYWTQVDVVFLAAVSPQRPNPLGYSSKNLVRVASLVQRDVSGTTDQTQVVSPGVNLVDTGVKDGWWVRLPNDGGQWTTSYDRPVLDVQVVGPTAEGVSARMVALLKRINEDLARRQDAAHVATDQRVTTGMSLPTVAIQYSQGPVKRGLMVILFLGVGLSLLAADWWDRRGGQRVVKRGRAWSRVVRHPTVRGAVVR